MPFVQQIDILLQHLIALVLPYVAKMRASERMG
jgi:hypothetical protein